MEQNRNLINAYQRHYHLHHHHQHCEMILEEKKNLESKQTRTYTHTNRETFEILGPKKNKKKPIIIHNILGDTR